MIFREGDWIGAYSKKNGKLGIYGKLEKDLATSLIDFHFTVIRTGKRFCTEWDLILEMNSKDYDFKKIKEEDVALMEL